MNAVLLAHGFTCGERDGARQSLKDFWESVATGTQVEENIAIPSGSAAAVLKTLLFMARFVSPYQFNPLDVNPLRDILLASACLSCTTASRLMTKLTGTVDSQQTHQSCHSCIGKGRSVSSRCCRIKYTNQSIAGNKRGRYAQLQDVIDIASIRFFRRPHHEQTDAEQSYSHSR
jgi:mannitol/fructose-specific phosphotransferase system IIA component (Ntr-type)